MDTKKRKVKEPVKKGVAKVPIIMQMEALECGAACLTMVLAYYEKWIPLEEVRVSCGVSRDGSNAKNVLKAARFYGLKADGYKVEPEVLMEQAAFPCIIHWNFNHFVVLDGFTGKKAILNDPARDKVEVSLRSSTNLLRESAFSLNPGRILSHPESPRAFWILPRRGSRGRDPRSLSSC